MSITKMTCPKCNHVNKLNAEREAKDYGLGHNDDLEFEYDCDRCSMRVRLKVVTVTTFLIDTDKAKWIDGSDDDQDDDEETEQ